jgi:predicted O-methyltransferase YrrM
MAVIRHAETWIDLDHLGASRPYRYTFDEGMRLGATHRRLLTAPLQPGSVAIDTGIPGSLRREDAAKLYELVFFGAGNALVLGSGQGLAAAIAAQAIYDSGRAAIVVAVDASGSRIERSRANLAALNLRENVELVEDEPAAFCDQGASRGLRFGVIFADHSTTYGYVRSLCRSLPALTPEGGFVLFHDFNDRRNGAPGERGYGVYAGVLDGLPAPPFEFYGVFGCTGLFRKADATMTTVALATEPVPVPKG